MVRSPDSGVIPVPMLRWNALLPTIIYVFTIEECLCRRSGWPSTNINLIMGLMKIALDWVLIINVAKHLWGVSCNTASFTN